MYIHNIFYEETEYDNQHKYPVFIVLTYGGGPLGKIISKVTGDEWTHAMISFNPKLEPMYSFALRTQKSDEKQSMFGFTYQNTTDKLYARKEVKYLVYCMYVSKEVRNKMQERLNYFIDHEKEYKYDFAGLINIWKNKDSESHRKYFCSRFVAEILNEGSSLKKLPSLYRPQELNNIDNISLINAGTDMYEYDYKVTLKNMKKIKEKKFFDRKYQSGEIASHVRVAESAADRFINGILSCDKFLEIYDELL